MKYKIKVNYSTTLVFDDYEDFINAIGMLFNGGCEEMDIGVIKEEV